MPQKINTNKICASVAKERSLQRMHGLIGKWKFEDGLPRMHGLKRITTFLAME
jgi:hypothetical protein